MNISHGDILKNLSIASLNEMQEEMILAFSMKDDILLLSPTGSGKTLGFLLPLLNTLDASLKKVQVLILVPSRELALQIETVFKSMKTPFKVNCCYGGHDFKVERNNLQTPPAVIVGTPGRIADHIDKNTFDTDGIHTIVFDEFDKSLEFGFSNEMEYIVKQLRSVKRKVLTSATQAIEIPSFVKAKNIAQLNFLGETNKPDQLTVMIVISDDVDKLKVLLKLISFLDTSPTIIFCNHREVVERISGHLTQNNIENDCFHGKLDQADREKVLAKFRNGSTNILITTDLASRGLDINEVKNIIHYQKPLSEEIFIHRNGRTARMHSTGDAYMILTQKEERPDYLPEDIEILELPETTSLPKKPQWATLTFSKGKKDNINKMDIVGFLSKVGKLNKDELGLIEVKDFLVYAAVKQDKVKSVLSLTKDQKIKNRAVKISVED
ncbi:MAG: dbpA [Bacteroidota bacterium]|nr:dbpA [Bacteroidota bacterium]